MITKIINKIKELACYDAFLILQSPVDFKIENNNDDYVIKKITASESIKAVYLQIGRSHPDNIKNIDARIQHQLSFFILTLNDEIVATCWMLYNVPRFIDELAISVIPDENYLWIRDVFVIEKYRGKNHFSRIILKIVHQYYKDKVDQIYSDVQRSNLSSIRAHKKLGFLTVDEMNYFILFKKFLIRSIYSVKIKLTLYKEKNRFLIKNRAFEHYIKKYIA